MANARKEIVRHEEVLTYHCTARCVRRAFLCGQDVASGRNFEHRRIWIRDRLKFLSRIFTIDVISYAVQSNHLHIVLRTRCDLAEKLSDLDVALRWFTLYPPSSIHWEDAAEELKESFLQATIQDRNRIAIYRYRLSDLSCFMGRMDEFIARKANREDDCKGRFWEGRFKCKLLMDEAALFTCMMYVDLNAIRAGEAKTPEESRYTSAYDRIKAHKATEALKRICDDSKSSPPIISAMNDCLIEDQKSADWLCPLNATADRMGIFQSISLSEYLDTLDMIGRESQPGKKGFIPLDLIPILDRLSISTNHWIETVNKYESLFHRILGRVEKVIDSAKLAGLRWFQGIRVCREVFG